MLKYRPSKSFVLIVIPSCVLAAVLGFGLLPELKEFEARPIPGEIAFSSAKPAAIRIATVSSHRTISFQRPMEWLEEAYENLMNWEYYPWKSNSPGGFSRYLTRLESDAPADQAYCREMERRVEAEFQKLLLRYPEMAVTMKSVPDDRNGFLKWLEFSEKIKAANPGVVPGIDFPKELDDFLNHRGAWNAEIARNWLAQQKSLIDEIRAIGQMPDQSTNGIAVDRWSFISARLVKNSVEGLILEARLAAEEGDASTALESIRTARGLADHFNKVETPTLLGATVQKLMQRELEKFALTQIMPALPAGQLDPAEWENALNPQVSSPAELARYMKGEWSTTVRQYVLPMILDADDPDAIPDGGDFLDAQVAPFLHAVRSYEGAAISDLPAVNMADYADFSHLSRRARKLGGILFVGANAWMRGWQRNQSESAMTQAAFAIMKGQPIPNDPIYGQAYVWDPATRALSPPETSFFKEMDIKSIIVPKP